MDTRFERLESRIGRLLIAGVAVAGAVVLIGGMLYLRRYGAAHVDYRVFSGEPADLRTIGNVVGAAAHASSRAMIQLGLLVLVAVQLVRVAFTAWMFEAMHDRAFVYVSLTVLAMLAYSLLREG